jgi:hypothetical protein
MANLVLVMDVLNLNNLDLINKNTLYIHKTNKWSRQSLRTGQPWGGRNWFRQTFVCAGGLSAFGGSATPCRRLVLTSAGIHRGWLSLIAGRMSRSDRSSLELPLFQNKHKITSNSTTYGMRSEFAVHVFYASEEENGCQLRVSWDLAGLYGTWLKSSDSPSQGPQHSLKWKLLWQPKEGDPHHWQS